MNIKKRKLTLILGSLGLLVGISATIISTSLYSNNIANSNNLASNNNTNEQVNEQNSSKTVVPGDYLLNDQNAIELENNITSPSTYAITSGPRGFVSVINNFITYTSFDGKVIATSTISAIIGVNDLISIEYNDYAKSFVCLFNYQNIFLQVVSIKESDFTMTKTQNITVRQDFPPDLSRVILTPSTINSYLVVIQSQHIDNVASPNPIPVYYINCSQNSTDFLINTLHLPGMQWNDVVVAAGGFEATNAVVYINLLIYNSSDRNFYMNFYIGVNQNNYSFTNFQKERTATNDTNLDANYILNNNLNTIYSYEGLTDEDDEWHYLYVILNWNDSAPIMNKWSHHYNNPPYPGTPTTFCAIESVVSFDVNNSYKYEFDFGRVFGDYLYAYVDYKNYIDNASKKIMRLNLKNINNNNQLVWNNDYNNIYINLWDIPYQSSNFQPILAPMSNDSKSNILTFLNNGKNIWLVDGSKNALAYETVPTAINSNNIFMINGVSDIFVKDAASELKTYFTEALFRTNFTQFQKGTTYSVVKKENMLHENYKGNIPATLTIDKAYDNNSFVSVAKSLDIVLTGFNNEAKTWIEPTNTPINLNNFPYQITNPNTNNDIKTFIYENIIKGAYKVNLTPNNITKIELNSSSYDNKEGKLIFNSITLNKWYDDEGNEHNTEKTFTLANNANIEITGFKKVLGPTNLKSQTISVLGSPFASMNALEAADPAMKNEMLKWLNDNKDSWFNNLPSESNISDLTIISNTSTIGEITINFTIDGYFANDSLFSYTIANQQFDNITLTDFVIKNWATTTKQPTKNVEGNLSTMFPSEMNLNNAEFKQYLFDNVIVDDRKNVKVSDIENFTGNADNLLGTYVLTSITLSLATGSEGNLITTPTTFDGFQYEIRGFKSNSLETSINVSPKEPLPDALKNILAQKTTINIPEFKSYIFNFVLIDRTNPKLLTDAVIDNDSIVDPVYDNLTGTIKFKLRINNSIDINGAFTNTPKTFDEIITISGFKKVLPTSLKVDPIISNAGDINVWGDDVLEATYIKIIKDNFNSILTNTPEGFNETNITNVTKTRVDNNSGTIYVDISINLYYSENNGLELVTPELIFNNIEINGWKAYPFIILNNRVDVLLYQNSYANQFAGSVVNSVADINLLLRDQNFLNIICPDQQGLTNAAFSAATINRIDNLKGEIEFVMNVNGGQFHPNQNIVTLYGFRPTITIGNWISQISNIKGTGTTKADIEKDVLEQVWNATNNLISPFGNPILKNNITVFLKSSSSISVSFNTSNFIDNSANIIATPTDISFNVNYEILSPKNSENNDWIYIVVFSITGVVGFILLIWLTYVIIKKCQDKWFK